MTFTTPQVAFTTPSFVTDPFVLRLFGGKHLMYLHDSTGIRIAESQDGLAFSSLTVIPGALQLPDGRVRLFDCDASGIVSATSPDGIANFIPDPDPPAIAAAPGTLVCDPHPVALREGGYLMAYKIIPPAGTTPLDDEVYLATSDNALKWTAGTLPVARGGVPSLVELADGTLLLYYVDFNY